MNTQLSRSAPVRPESAGEKPFVYPADWPSGNEREHYKFAGDILRWLDQWPEADRILREVLGDRIPCATTGSEHIAPGIKVSQIERASTSVATYRREDVTDGRRGPPAPVTRLFRRHDRVWHVGTVSDWNVVPDVTGLTVCERLLREPYRSVSDLALGGDNEVGLEVRAVSHTDSEIDWDCGVREVEPGRCMAPIEPVIDCRAADEYMGRLFEIDRLLCTCTDVSARADLEREQKLIADQLTTTRAMRPFKRIWEDLIDNRERYEEARSRRDFCHQEALEARRGELIERFRGQRSVCRRIARGADAAVERVRVRVANRIRRAIAVLTTAGPHASEVATHLRESIQPCRGGRTYWPHDRHAHWELS